MLAGPEVPLSVLGLLVLAAVTAGFIDSVVGGGGLVQLPALLVALPGVSPVEILATNKLASAMGVTVSSATYYRRVRPDPRVFGPMMLMAFAGAAGGALVAFWIPRSAFDPIVLVVLVLVGAWVLLKPSVGVETELRLEGRRHTTAAMLVGLVIGFYDGVLGPGTGSFLVVALVSLGYSFLDASANARLANWATNVAALVVFVPQGAVLWGVGLLMGLGNVLGAYVGARLAVSRGAGFVRAFFVAVVAAFVVRIGGDVLGVWG
ncbi:TSUP family transporter [Nocardioides lentus]|uniref:Probable membrane transporter protein n=1 Tax=Nocardioides lentus TaxID=338077 RepID=A0ABN2PE40_9ACTN